jgi:hypothetical protein
VDQVNSINWQRSESSGLQGIFRTKEVGDVGGK